MHPLLDSPIMWRRMVALISIFTAGTMLFISGLHFYWALGGDRGVARGLPLTKKRVLRLWEKGLVFGVATFILHGTFTALGAGGLLTWGFHGIWFTVGTLFWWAILLFRATAGFFMFRWMGVLAGTAFVKCEFRIALPLSMLLSIAFLVLFFFG